MLEDRDYMRARPGNVDWSVTTVLTVVMALVFALQCVNDVYLHTRAEYWLALTPACFEQGRVWQLITFQFLHATVWHIACNLLVFWWVGHFVEKVLGKRRFLVAMFGCGVVGGALQEVLMILFPAQFGLWVVGASAGVAGLFAIFALLEKDSQVLLFFLFPVRALTLLWAFGIISLFFTLVPTPREWGLANAAHLGGLLAGIAWVKMGWHRDYVQLPWEGWLERIRQWRSPGDRRQKRKLVKAFKTQSSAWSSSTGETEGVSTDDFVKSEVDPILEKISAHGIHSLTAKEREILEKARKKMTGR